VRTEAFGCGCFVKVYVCPQHLNVGAVELSDRVQALRDQLQLGILDNEVSVSALVEGEANGEHQI